MADYSVTDKFLHRVYLGNYAIANAALEMEEILKGPEAKKQQIAEYVFVTGLARSGTTAVMNKIFKSGEYASLQYSNMPFLLNPNLWKRRLNIESHERAHNDGIIIDGNSPEEFDEFFWKSQLKDSYIGNEGLALHEVDDKLLEKFNRYLGLVCLAKKKTKYLSKNNNNILRLAALKKLPNSKFIILFRHPISHASSLLKLHLRFSKNQEKDTFVLDYFNYLGHYEFGLNHKPFLLTKEFNTHRDKYPKDSIDYWLAIWLNYYRYTLENLKGEYILICFEDLVAKPDKIYNFIQEKLSLSKSLEKATSHKPTQYKDVTCDPELLKECMDSYQALRSLRKYIDNGASNGEEI